MQLLSDGWFWFWGAVWKNCSEYMQLVLPHFDIPWYSFEFLKYACRPKSPRGASPLGNNWTIFHNLDHSPIDCMSSLAAFCSLLWRFLPSGHIARTSSGTVSPICNNWVFLWLHLKSFWWLLKLIDLLPTLPLNAISLGSIEETLSVPLSSLHRILCYHSENNYRNP